MGRFEQGPCGTHLFAFSDKRPGMVILRPGTLSDAEGSGLVTAGPAIAYGEVPRADVAATLVALVERPGITRAIIELTAGTTPVGDALHYLAAQS